ncbi:MAG: hypothetical protein A2W90_00035 [Bacteroidetes bacterium GWF2_42_66]|nr:MAG: hypothetical protein A2W92_09215 [Bacteroidetes bacterium GWA2_42_15]OFX97903.1 MAG: hypothetical protein A2W89_07550 [Bacteroidetes bacterium GWE2_42_39]OFY44120.1 MAG: hypothetical protein A2W90_00035 [Bacteroidetes bacterium GWF2_42_66]
MKTNLKFIVVLLPLSFMVLFNRCNIAQNQQEEKSAGNRYIVAAYVWPSCHDEPMSREKLWGEGIGEWEMIQKGNPRFEGHYQPRIPLWGYKMDDDPQAWEQKIDAATLHGVNTFIFDWYWYDGKPFLEEAVDLGFLGASNNEKANFYIMWANHDVPGNMWNHYRYKTDSLIWHGDVDWENYKIVVDRVIKQYFNKPNYLKIDGKPVFSVYSLGNLVEGFKNNLEETAKALDYFREEVKKAGFPGLHLQLVGGERNGEPCFWGVDASVSEIVKVLGVNSVTMYNMAGKRGEDYLSYGEHAVALRKGWDSTLDIPFFPCVSIGWDNTPRYPEYGKEKVVHYHNTPQSFGAYLQKAKEYADAHPEQPKIVAINAWNEWVEGSYLEPDMLNGYGYLETVKKVMSGEFDNYSNK